MLNLHAAVSIRIRGLDSDVCGVFFKLTRKTTRERERERVYMRGGNRGGQLGWTGRECVCVCVRGGAERECV